jgi:hypothetical protein
MGSVMRDQVIKASAIAGLARLGVRAGHYRPAAARLPVAVIAIIYDYATTTAAKGLQRASYPCANIIGGVLACRGISAIYFQPSPFWIGLFAKVRPFQLCFDEATEEGRTGLRAFHANFQTILSIGLSICRGAAFRARC